MTVTRHTTGPALISVQYGPFQATPPALAVLGYSQDGVQITERALQSDVFSDRNGGLQGAPVDVQQMSVVTEIRCEMNDYEISVLTRLRQRSVKTALADGQIATPGGLLLAEDEQVRVLIVGAKDSAAIGGGGSQADYTTPLNYMNCVVRDALSLQLGSKVTMAEVTFTAYPFVDPADSLLKIFNRDTTN